MKHRKSEEEDERRAFVKSTKHLKKVLCPLELSLFFTYPSHGMKVDSSIYCYFTFPSFPSPRHSPSQREYLVFRVLFSFLSSLTFILLLSLSL